MGFHAIVSHIYQRTSEKLLGEKDFSSSPLRSFLSPNGSRDVLFHTGNVIRNGFRKETPVNLPRVQRFLLEFFQGLGDPDQAQDGSHLYLGCSTTQANATLAISVGFAHLGSQLAVFLHGIPQVRPIVHRHELTGLGVKPRRHKIIEDCSGKASESSSELAHD